MMEMSSDYFCNPTCQLVALGISLLSPRTFLLNRYKHPCELSRLLYIALSFCASSLPTCSSNLTA
jgi:hypothetical protein